MRNTAGRLSGVGFCLFLCGCLNAHTELAPASAGGNAWQELDSDHFRVVTDLKERDAVNVLAEYEHVYDLLVAATHVSEAGGSTAEPSFETQSIVFRTYDELQPFVPAQIVGQYRSVLPNDIEGVPTILASGTVSPFGRVTLAHELAHRFNHVALGTMPVWLNEGLAQYYSTIRGDVAHPVVGESDPDNVAASGSVRHSPGDMVFQGELIHAAALPKASQLLGLDSDGFYAESGQNRVPLTYEAKNTQTRNYAASWMLVHMLLHEQTDYAVRFRELLEAPDGLGTGQALQGVLENVDASRLDRDFHAYLQKDIPWRQYHAGLSPRPRLTNRGLSDAEVLLWWARLDSFTGDDSARATKRLNDAQKANQADADVQFWLGRKAARDGNFVAAAESYEHAAQAAPDRPEFLLGLVTVYESNATKSVWPDRQQRLDQALARLSPIAASPMQFNVLAMQALFAHDAAKAAQLAERARHVGPDCWQCWHTAAAAAAVGGDTRHSVEFEHVALARAPEDLSVSALRVLQDALRFYERIAHKTDAAERLTLPPLFMPE